MASNTQQHTSEQDFILTPQTAPNEPTSFQQLAVDHHTNHVLTSSKSAIHCQQTLASWQQGAQQ